MSLGWQTLLCGLPRGSGRCSTLLLHLDLLDLSITYLQVWPLPAGKGLGFGILGLCLPRLPMSSLLAGWWLDMSTTLVGHRFWWALATCMLGRGLAGPTEVSC